MTGRTVIVALTAGQFQKIAVGPVMEVTRFKTMIDKLPIVWQQGRMRPNFIHDIRILLIGFLLVITAFTAAIAADKQIFEAEAAEPVGGASKVADGAASGGFLAGLTKPGQGVKFAPLRAASKLAIRYASVEVGTISVAVVRVLVSSSCNVSRCFRFPAGSEGVENHGAHLRVATVIDLLGIRISDCEAKIM